MFTQIRPVGNKIKLNSSSFDSSLFSPFFFSGYQSGTASLAAAIICLKNQCPHIKKPEILLPAYTCPDIISACIFAKVSPILVDLENHRPWMDLDEIKRKINLKTIGIIAINFLGIPERIKEIREITSESKLLIIEDSAQGIPKTSPKEYWEGDLIITSFGRGKPLSLFGGGSVLCKDKQLLDYLPNPLRIEDKSLDKIIFRLKTLLINLLSTPVFYFLLTKLSFLKLGETKYKKLDNINALPNVIKTYLNYSKSRYDLLEQLNTEISEMITAINSEHIIDLPKACQLKENFPLLRYPLLITDLKIKNKISFILEKQRLGVSYMYKKALANIDGIPREIKLFEQKNDVADKFSTQLITLPTHSGINKKTIRKIKQAIQSGLNG